jgi:hypothetical protein
MQRIEIANLTEELAAVMALRWTQGYTVEQALCIARQKQEAIQANYRLWAANPTNDRALREARENAIAISYVCRVLEAGAALEQAQEAPAKSTFKRTRCPYAKAIREFMAVAREAGLDVTAKDRCRGALGQFLGKRVESRADLTGRDWAVCASGVRMGRLAW